MKVGLEKEKELNPVYKAPVIACLRVSSILPAGAPTSYLLTGFLHSLHFTSMENTVLDNTDTGGCNMDTMINLFRLAVYLTCSTLGNRVANAKLSAKSPLEPLL